MYFKSKKDLEEKEKALRKIFPLMFKDLDEVENSSPTYAPGYVSSGMYVPPQKIKSDGNLSQSFSTNHVPNGMYVPPQKIKSDGNLSQTFPTNYMPNGMYVPPQKIKSDGNLSQSFPTNHVSSGMYLPPQKHWNDRNNGMAFSDSMVSGNKRNSQLQPQKTEPYQAAMSDSTSCFPDKWDKMNNMERFMHTIGFSFKKEGGYVNNKLDTGGETNYGITESFLREYRDSVPEIPMQIKSITKEHATGLYRAHWNKFRVGGIDSPKVALCINDYIINSNAFEAIRRIQKLLKEMRYDIKADCIVGKKTLEAINDCNPDTLCRLILDERYNHYNETVGNKSDQIAFIRGWMNRLNSLSDILGCGKKYKSKYEK